MHFADEKNSVSRLRRRILTLLSPFGRSPPGSEAKFILPLNFYAVGTRPRRKKERLSNFSTTHSSIALNQLGKMSPRRCVCFNKFLPAQLWPGRKETSLSPLHFILLWTYLLGRPPNRLPTPRGDNLCMKYTAGPLYQISRATALGPDRLIAADCHSVARNDAFVPLVTCSE